MRWLNKHRRKIQVGGLVLAVLVALLCVFWRDTFVGEGARIDSADIVAMARGERPWLDDHYKAVGDVYAAVGLVDHAWVVGLVAVATMSVLIVWLHYRGGQVGWGTWGIEVVAIVLAGYYMGALSKDVFELLLVSCGCLMVIGRKQWWWVAVMAAAMLLFAWFVRPYWAVIAGLFVLGVVIWSLPLKWLRSQRRWVWLGMTVLMVVGGAVGYYALTGDDISGIRHGINTTTNLADTRIWAPVVGGGVLGAIVNSLYVFVGFFVPVQLFALQSLFYAFAGVCFVLLFGYFAHWLWTQQGKRWDAGRVRAVALLGAYMAVVSLFEPDYSSLLRHLVAIMPFMIYCYVVPKKVARENIS